MASGFISRLLPMRSDAPSVYDTIRQNEDDNNTDTDTSDGGETRGLTLDERNLGEDSFNLDIEAAKLDLEESRATSRSARFPRKNQNDDGRSFGNRASRANTRSRERKPSRLLDVEEANDEVPASLLIEGGEVGAEGPPTDLPSDVGAHNYPIPSLRSPNRSTRVQWEAVRTNQRLHSADAARPAHVANVPGEALPGLGLAHPKDKAMWRWANVENLDNFINDVYIYYLGNGIWSILLSRCLNLLTLAFVVGFSTFLLYCVDVRSIPHRQILSEVLVPQCTKKMSSLASFLLWMFCFLWIAKLFQWILNIRTLLHMRDFYQYLLGVSDNEIQTISWQEIVGRLMNLRDSNPTTAPSVSARHRRFLGSQSKERMDAHDIANRLMRKENYLIALFNKEILDLTLPIPFMRNRQLFSRNLEWNINLCVLDFVFNDQGQVRKAFLKDSHRQELSDGLRRRFLIAGYINIFVAPFMVVYFLMLYFFRNFTEYQKNPGRIGSRKYSRLAEWKFREFNELWHLFERRINMSYPFASRYVDQFPKDKTIQSCRFVAFVSGALAAVLALGALFDTEMFLSFEITPNRTVLFYLTVFGAIWAATRNTLPDDNLVFDPEQTLSEVTAFTRYDPAHWEGRYHSDEVRREFTQLYQMEVVIFLEEILSMVFTPFILWLSLPRCSERLIDFFREFTVHVDGLGYVCSFAVFDFQKNANLVRPKTDHALDEQGKATAVRHDYYSTKDNKLEASYWGFMNDYAQNPKTGIPFYSPQVMRHRYRPPPPFPGPMSPSLTAGLTQGLTVTGKQDRLGRSRPGMSKIVGGASQNARLPGLDQTLHEEPPTSLLLDRDHQPSLSDYHTSTGRQARSRNRPSRRQSAMTRTADADEEDEAYEEAVSLGESWELQRAGMPAENEINEDGVDRERSIAPNAGERPSVLGIIRQFQMDRTHGRANAGIL